MSQTKAPWTDEQVAALDKWQKCNHVHPFTCPYRSEEDHVGSGRLTATKDGWVCPECEYTQDWAHDFMFDERITQKPPFSTRNTQEKEK